MVKDNIEALLHAEWVAAMRKRPGMYMGGTNHEGLQAVFSVIFKSILRADTDPLRVEWIIEDDQNCSFIINGAEGIAGGVYPDRFSEAGHRLYRILSLYAFSVFFGA